MHMILTFPLNGGFLANGGKFGPPPSLITVEEMARIPVLDMFTLASDLRANPFMIVNSLYCTREESSKFSPNPQPKNG